jgi:endonuclease YncB( thermonuclease family)
MVLTLHCTLERTPKLELSALPRHAFAGIALAATLSAGLAAPCSAQTEDRPLIRNVPPPSAIRTHRLPVPNDFFKRDAVRFERAQIDMSGSIRADGHNLDLYGVVRVRRNRICTSADGARWACGQHAFMALRKLLDGQSITCSFRHITVPPKVVCWVGDSDVTQFLLDQGWAELADGVTEETYVDAQASAQSRKAGVWGDGPP